MSLATPRQAKPEDPSIGELNRGTLFLLGYFDARLFRSLFVDVLSMGKLSGMCRGLKSRTRARLELPRTFVV